MKIESENTTKTIHLSLECTLLTVNTALMNTYRINIYIAWDQSDQEKRSIV